MDKTAEYMELVSMEYFIHVSALAHRIRRVQEIMTTNRDNMLSVKAVSYDKGGSSGPYHDAIPDAVAAYDGLERKYAASVREMLDQQREAVDVIQSMRNQSYADLLTYYYLLGYPLKSVAISMDITARQVRRLHKPALVAAYHLIPEQSRSEIERRLSLRK